MTRRATTFPPVCAILAIVVAVVAAYSNSFSGPFVFDDLLSIKENKTIRNLRSVEVLIPPGKITVSRRPLTNLSLAVNYAIGKLDVRSYHVGNLLIHLLAALTLLGIVRRTLLLPKLRDRFGRASTGLATAVALIWALHPLQTESVTYIVQRAESLMGLCCLLTLYSVIRAASSSRPATTEAERPADRKSAKTRKAKEQRRSWFVTIASFASLRFRGLNSVAVWSVAAVAVCALGMGAKEVMATAPIVVLLYDRAFLAGSFRETFRRRGALYLGLAATWAVLGAILLLYPGPAGASFGMIKMVTPWQYALTQPGVILYYLRLSFWPNTLCLDYLWPIATSAWQIIPAAAVIAALLAGTLWALRRAPALGFFGAWFFLILAPSSSFVPIITEVAAEHRMYLPLAALIVPGTVAAYLLVERLTRRSSESEAAARRATGVIAITLVVAISGTLGALTFLRNQDYQSPISIWKDTVSKQENNPRALLSLGTACFGDRRFDDAVRCYNRAIELSPEYDLAYYNRGLVLSWTNDHAGAIRDYDKSISLNPNSADAHLNRGNEYVKTNRLSKAIQDYGRAISLKPDYAEAFFNRATTYVTLRRYDLALADCCRAIELNPGYAAAWNARAVVYSILKEYDKAWRDVAAFQKLGGQPNADFLKALKQASGRSE